MFTSEPSLAQRIERMIGDTPIVDPSSLIPVDRPGVPDLAALLLDSPARVGLQSVGMPAKDLDPALPSDERVRRIIPHLARMRNTSTAWCLFRIFRDLYDFDEPNLTEANYLDLFDRVAQAGRDPHWASSVLRGRSNIQAVATIPGPPDADPSPIVPDLYYRLDLDALFRPGPSTQYYEELTSLLGDRPTSTERLERLVFDWLDRAVTGRTRFCHASLPTGRGLRPPDEVHAQFALTQAADDWVISDAEADWLSAFVSWSVLKWHHENGKSLLLTVESDPTGDGGDVPTSRLSTMARAFRQFRRARFGLVTGGAFDGRDVAALASRLPNVHAAGDCGPDLTPTEIEANVGLRVQAVPMTKVVGFLGGAESAEWTYGRLQAVKKSTAAALARLVEGRSFEEDEIPPLLRQVFHDSPRELYDLRE